MCHLCITLRLLILIFILNYFSVQQSEALVCYTCNSIDSSCTTGSTTCPIPGSFCGVRNFRIKFAKLNMWLSLNFIFLKYNRKPLNC